MHQNAFFKGLLSYLGSWQHHWASSGATAAGTCTHREDIQTQQREAEGSSSTLLCVILTASLFPLTLANSRKKKSMLSYSWQDKPEVPTVCWHWSLWLALISLTQNYFQTLKFSTAPKETASQGADSSGLNLWGWKR